MVDWLAVWGVTQAVGFVFKPILEDLAKDSAKDFVKDFFKDSLKHVLLREKDPRQVATGKALKEFLLLVQQELKFRKIPEFEIKEYTKALKQFISNKSVKEILGKGFDPDCDELDAKILEDTWNQLQLPSLPARFNWQAITDQYLRKTQEILWNSDDLRVILDSHNLKSIEESTKEIAGIIPSFDLIKYRKAIQDCYGHINLQSLDTSGYAYDELKLWRMFIPQNVREVHKFIPQIHELPKEHLRRLRESKQLEAEISLEEVEQYKQVYLEQPIRSVLDIVNDRQNYKYLVILGDPGSGKSTLLQYLALTWAESPLNNAPLPIPLLIELRTYIDSHKKGNCNNFLEFFHESPGAIFHLNQHQLQKQLEAGNAIVMFDGLDEIFDSGEQKDVVTSINRFTNTYSNVQLIVTSRAFGYKAQQLADAKFSHFMLQDLDSEQIKDFVNRWHELTFKDEADKVRKKERLQTAIDTSASIRELAENPMLLTLMAILNRNKELPRDRPELYNQASELLLQQWDVERNLIERRLDPNTIRYKDKQAMLRQVAYHMQANEKGLAGNSIVEDDLVNILSSYLKSIEVNDARAVAWLMIKQLRTRNFILCYKGADRYAFVHRTFLEHFCAWEIVWQFEKKQQITLDELKTEVFSKHWKDESWREVLCLITGMIEPKFAGELIDYLIEQNGKEEKFISIFLAAKCFSEVSNRTAIAPTSARLVACITELAKNGNLDMQYAAVLAIARFWKDRPDTLPWLKTIAQSDDDSFVRSTAVLTIAQGWKDRPDTLPWLKTIAQTDDDSYMRGAAVEASARFWKDRPDTLPWLKTIAQSNDDSFVRAIAVQEIAYGWKDEPGVFEFLCDRAIDDPFKRKYDWENPRQWALEDIIQYYPNHPQTLPLLHDRAENDTDQQVREFAKKKLWEWGVRK